MPNELWAGIDIGKEHHHCVVIDETGQRLLSTRIANDETALTILIDEVLAWQMVAKCCGRSTSIEVALHW